MAGLIKSLPPRSSVAQDKKVIQRTSKRVNSTPVLKSGTSLYDKIANISAVVNTKLSKYKEEYLLLRQEDEIRDYFNKILECNECAIDTETSSLDPITTTLAGICLYAPGYKACYIPLHHISYVTGIELENQASENLLTELLQLCEDNDVRWIYHNAVFDKRVIRNQLNVDLSVYWDTMLAGSCLNENESHRLKDLHFKYCKTKDSESLTYDKLFDGIPFTYIPINVGYLYAAGDAIKTWELMQFQKQYLNEERLPGCYNIFRNIEIPIVTVVCDMEDRGVALDIEYAKTLQEKYSQQLQERESRVYECLEEYKDLIEDYKLRTPNHKLSDPIGIGSPVQVAIILYDILKLKSSEKDKPRGTGEEILRGFKNKFCDALLDYRETGKLMSTYIQAIPELTNPKTGRIHCNFRQYGAATGRFSSQNPNLQNIPSHNKEIRKMFCATPGYVLVSGDYSQQEPRTLASLSKDEHLQKAYLEGKDLYAWIGSMVYKLPYEDCLEFYPDGSKNAEGKERRTQMKFVLLGLMYGRGANAIAEQMSISREEAQKVIDSFYGAFPKTKQWMDNIQKGAKVNGYVETAWGRKRRLPDMRLPEYSFDLLKGGPSNFDPLDFETEDIVLEVDPVLRTQYYNRLKKVWKNTDKRKIIDEAREKGIKITDNGGKIADASRQCVNSVIQGTSADMTKVAMININNNKRLKELDCHILIPVHDEVICECPEENAKECSLLLSEIMIQSAKERITVPMKVDTEVTRCWYGEEIHLND